MQELDITFSSEGQLNATEGVEFQVKDWNQQYSPIPWIAIKTPNRARQIKHTISITWNTARHITETNYHALKQTWLCYKK